MLIHGLVRQGGLQSGDRLARRWPVRAILRAISATHLHCTIMVVYPAPRALRPRCRLLEAEFGEPNPLNFCHLTTVYEPFLPKVND